MEILVVLVVGIIIFVFINKIFKIAYFGFRGITSVFVGCCTAAYIIVSILAGLFSDILKSIKELFSTAQDKYTVIQPYLKAWSIPIIVVGFAIYVIYQRHKNKNKKSHSSGTTAEIETDQNATENAKAEDIKSDTTEV